MRLLNTKTLELTYFVPGNVPDYVILSHRWCTPTSEECTFEDIRNTPLSSPDSRARRKQGFSKIDGSCRLASQDNYEWIWIDSCCIDKSSSAELQESINSMWKYYANSNICYVYMADVSASEAGEVQGFSQSAWFNRGWTLQELIAPVHVEFYSGEWALVGTKFERYEEIAEITGIDQEVLVRTLDVDYFSASERLSWAAHRQVTREEDESYSLLGLFNVCLPLLYGEGRERAFMRLQEAIFNTTTDHSLLLFRYSRHQKGQPLLADSPKCFCDSARCQSCPSGRVCCFPPTIRFTEIFATPRWATQVHEQIMTTVTATRYEMSTKLPLLAYRDVAKELIFDDVRPPSGVTHVAVLNHSVLKYREEGALCLFLKKGSQGEAYHRFENFPALLPNVAPHLSKLEKKTILVCPGPSDLGRLQYVHYKITVQGNSIGQDVKGNFRVRKGSSMDSVIRQTDKELEIQTRNPLSRLSQSVHFFYELTRSHNESMALLLELVVVGEILSIQRVFDLSRKKQRRKKDALFHCPFITDRCSISLSDGRRVSIAFRRQPISRCTRDYCGGSHRWYQVVIDMER